MLDQTKVQNTHTRRVICLMLTGLLLAACGGPTPAKTYTIGVVNYLASLEAVFAGFKDRMALSGYVEGKNITYIYHGVLDPDPQVIEREVKRLLDLKVDLFLTLGTRPTLAAKKAVTGTNIPVVFAPALTPLKDGLVESLRSPGGNVTGVQNSDIIPKGLEWLHKVVPQATKVHAMYHAGDLVAHTAIQSLPAIAASLGVPLVLNEMHSIQEGMAIVETMAKDEVIFLVPIPTLDPLSALIEFAVKRGIAVGSTNHSQLKVGALVTYAGSFSAIGQQAARLVDQILKGAKPADLPVETAEYSLHVNLQAATAMGLDIPDELLRQANMVMR